MSSINGHNNGFHIGSIHVPPQKTVRTPAPSNTEINEAPEQKEVFSSTGLTQAASKPAATESFVPQAATPQSSIVLNPPPLTFAHQVQSNSPMTIRETDEVQGIDHDRAPQMSTGPVFANGLHSVAFYIDDGRDGKRITKSPWE